MVQTAPNPNHAGPKSPLTTEAEPSAPVTVSAITEAMVKAFYTTAGYDVAEVVGPIERGGAGRANLVLRDGTLISLNVRLVASQ